MKPQNLPSIDNDRPKLFIEDIATNTGLVVKPTAYTNPSFGITEPQRKIILALAKGKGHFLIEVESINGRKRFRCLDRNKNIVSNNFSKVVVRNLLNKGFLLEVGNKIYLK